MIPANWKHLSTNSGHRSSSITSSSIMGPIFTVMISVGLFWVPMVLSNHEFGQAMTMESSSAPVTPRRTQSRFSFNPSQMTKGFIKPAEIGDEQIGGRTETSPTSGFYSRLLGMEKTTRMLMSDGRRRGPWGHAWFPRAPDAEPSNLLPSSTSSMKLDQHGRVQMGVEDDSCDNAKTNLTLDWDFSPVDYTCFHPETRFPVNPNIEHVIDCVDLAPTYMPNHLCMDKPITYSDSIPTYGDHRPLWPKFGEYLYVPKQRWLHNIEHGAVVMLYHPCAHPEEVQRLRTLVTHCYGKHVITPNIDVQPERPLQLVAWGCSLKMAVVNDAIVINFIREKGMKGPEGNYTKEGQFDFGLLRIANETKGARYDRITCDSPAPYFPESDLTTDLPKYHIYRHGKLKEEVSNIQVYWTENLVTFLIGCSFSFESHLINAGVPVRNIEQGKNVSMFISSLKCKSIGAVSSPLVVSYRPVPSHLVQIARDVTEKLGAAHGPPIHIGDPSIIGIQDLSRPDYGDYVVAASGDIPMFWACGVTTTLAATSINCDLIITHAPGHMFITDITEFENIE